MRSIEILQSEHRVIERGLAVLEAMARRVQEGTSPPLEEAEALLGFFQVFADRCHHLKEEWGLFPHMDDEGVPCLGGPLGVMLCEHVRGRALRRQMREALPGLAAEEGARQAFVQAVQEYVALMRQHIAKEEQVLFGMAQEVTSPPQDEALAQAFHRLEEEVVGQGMHERYHRLVEELASRYGT